MQPIRLRFLRFLRWSEQYTKTDMVYLAGVFVWTNATLFTNTLLALLLSIAFANLLPREVYGVYQFLLSLSALLTALCLGGMSQAVAQSVARGNEGDLRASLRYQLKWSIAPLMVGFIGALYYILHGEIIIATGLAVIAILAPLINAYGVYGGYLAGKQQFKRSFVYGLATTLAYYTAIFTTVFLSKDALVLVAVNLGVNAVAAVYFYYRTLKVALPNDQTDPHTLSYGTHLSIMNAFGTVINQLDSILVFHFLGATSLAIYSFATFIPERVGALTNFIGTAAFPKFSQRSLSEIQQAIISQTIRAAVLGGVLAVAYIAIAPLLFHLLFPKYIDTIPYTQWYAPVIVFLAANLALGALTAQRLKRELYLVSFLNPIMLISLQIPLLLLYGIWGMLIARIVSDMFGISLSIWLLLRKREV